MQRRAAVLRQSVGKFEGIELDVGVAMRQALDQGGRRLLGPGGVGRDAVADVEDVLPVLAGQVLIGGFDDCANEWSVDCIHETVPTGASGAHLRRP